jgi:hypothetical protein
MNASLSLETESPDISMTSASTPNEESEQDSLPRGSGLGLKTIEMLQRQILQAETLEQAKDLAKAAQREVLELIKRYEKRREQTAP